MARLIIEDGETTGEYVLGDAPATLGRVAGNTIVVPVAEVSRRHFRVTREKGTFFIEDLGSSNGTRVNDRLVSRAELRDGDIITVGKLRLRFAAAGDGPAPVPGPELEISLEEEADLLAVAGPRSGERLPVGSGRLTFGRNETNAVALDDDAVSSVHAEITTENGRHVLRDLGSTNGTWVGTERVEEHVLEAGDRIRIGRSEFVWKSRDGAAPAADATTSMMDVGEMGTGEIELVEARIRPRDRLTSILAGVVLLLLGGLVAFAVLGGDLGGGRRGGRRAATSAEPIRDNRVGADASSLESVRALDETWVEGDDSVSIARTEARAAHGIACLEVKRRDGGGGPIPGVGRALLAAPLSVASSGSWRVEAQLRTADVRGSAGLVAEWRSGSGTVLGLEYVAAPRTGDFERFVADLVAPRGAEALVPGVFIAGSGTVQMDALAVLERTAADVAKLEAHGAAVLPDASGRLRIARISEPVARAVGVHLLGPDGVVVPVDALAHGTGNLEGDTLAAEGRIPAAGALPAMTLRTRATRTERGVDIEASLDPVPDAPGLAVVFGFLVEADTAAQGLTVLEPEGARRVPGPFRIDGVTAVIAGGTGRRFALSAGTPATFILETRGTAPLLAVAAAPGTGSARFHIALDLQPEYIEARKLRDAGRRLESEGRSGEAVLALRKVLSAYPHDAEVADEAERAAAAILRKGQESLQRLTAEIDDLLFFSAHRNPGSAAPLLREISRLETGFQGTEIAAAAGVVRQRLETALTGAAAEREEALARSLVNRARDLPEAGAGELRKLLLLQVLALGPGASTWAGEARKLLGQ